eukprot:CAMPEP_0168725868 /NCGR_PEP_ID=MMETSP0724-20121128/4377_1 /TAXON_ID=265536 /ORGANISM="Amphiprora sp., Strain CCMP467" /LENGTH=278 /DNA_ID=CAMNT_0008772669 /DNA_START=178 /DNA_END=1011 /DNA_ORIENTATION=-
MGNNVAKDFTSIKLGSGTTRSTRRRGSTGSCCSEAEPYLPLGLQVQHRSDRLFTAGSVVERSTTVLVRCDPQRKSTIIFDQKSMLPLFVTKTYKKRSKGIATVESVTTDRDGKVLFLTTSPTKKERRIFKAPKSITPIHHHEHALESMEYAQRRDSFRSTDSTASSISTRSTDSFEDCWGFATSGKNDMLACAAEIDIDNSGSSVQAFFSVIVWTGAGPEPRPVLRATKIPGIKGGALVTDITSSSCRLVGKAFYDEKRMEPIIKIAAGADALSVIAL